MLRPIKSRPRNKASVIPLDPVAMNNLLALERHHRRRTTMSPLELPAQILLLERELLRETVWTVVGRRSMMFWNK